MAGANKRTSVFLTVLAVVFVIIIIILCLVPKPCHGPECDSSQVDQAKSRGEAPPDVITDAVTQTTSTTTTIAGAPATSTTASTTTTTTTTAAPTTTTTTATTAAPTTTITTTTTAAPTTTTTTPLAPTTVEPTTLSSTTKQSVTYTTEDDYPVLVTDESAAMTSTTQEPTTLRLTTEETTTLSATTEETTTLSATTEETTTLSETTEETTTLSATTEEETTLSATTEEETTLSATTEEETTLSATTEEETTLSATTEEETTLSATTEEDTTLLATTEESSTWSLTTEESTDESTLMTTTDESTSDNSTTIFNETKSEGICNTTSCKRLAARMLDMMDLGNVDPCEDFYQYSCGGVLDDLFLDPEDPKVQVDNLIKNKLVSGSPSDSVAEPIQQYYNSCLTFTLDYNETERLEQARNLFSNVSFEFNPNPALKKDELLPEYDTKFNLTTCLANMMKLHFAPFFDLHLDVDGSDNSKFALKLTPPLFSSPFSDDLAKAVCLKNYTNRLQEAELSTKQLDINSEYKIYQRCKSFDDGLSARLERMEHAVEHLKLMEHINNTVIQDKLLAQTRFNANFFLEAIAEHMPEIPDLRRGNIRKEYQEFTLEQLDHGPVFTSSVINWQQLVEEMLGLEITNPADVKVQVYFHEQLDEIVTEISEEYRTDPLNMQNILLLLWSERIYTSLVEPFGTSLSSPDYCFRATTFLMEDFASYLYLDALQPHLSSKKSKIENMIKIHKKTAEEQLLRKFNDADNSMIDKLHMMLGEVAEIDRIKEALQLNMQGVELSDNFLDNSVTLLQRYRTMMYAVYYKQPSHPQVMYVTSNT
nr:LOW QUALITY PROTEIN: ras guanine nucleotide exchange factor R-like [Cherax quadricarinatus]